MRRLLIITIAIVTLPTGVQAQNPCSDPPPPSLVAFNPSARLYVESAAMTATHADGTPEITDWQWAYFAEGADPVTGKPLQGPSTLPKADFQPVSGAANCFAVVPIAPVPTNTRLAAAFRSRHAAVAGLPDSYSPWVVSNPFGLPPAAPRGASRLVLRSTP